MYFLNCSEIVNKKVINVWGSKVDEFPTKYQGMPLYVGRLKSHY